jgi:hypothetical protein
MTKLKLTSLQDEKPVKLSVVLPAALHHDLVAYAEILSRETGKEVEPSKLIAPMLEKFIASDREFAKARGAQGRPNPQPAAAKPDAVPPTSSE